MENQATILAAGVGSRLRPITNTKPKCLVEINNVPIIGHMIKNLLSNHIDKITIVCGYKSDLIKEFCYKNFPDIHINFVDNFDYQQTNNLYSLYLARDFFKSGGFLMNADIIFDGTILSDMQSVKGSCIAVDKDNYIEESMKVTVENELINGIGKKFSEDSSYGCSIDLYKFETSDAKKIINKAEEILQNKNNNEWTELALHELLSSGELNTQALDILDRKWFEIDDLNDLVQAEMLFNEKLNSLNNKKIYFVDYDGTLSIGGSFMEEANQFLKFFPENKVFYVLTNNSSKTEEEVLSKLESSGADISNIKVLSSTLPAVSYLKENDIKKLYWVANEKVSKWIKSQGMIFDDVTPEAILLCYDNTITYEKISKLTHLVRKGVPYYATHTDLVCPIEEGYIPDIGCFIEMIESATNKRPIKTFGKPDADFILPIIKDLGLRVEDSVIIGDRLYTDIELGKNVGADTILVLSGETDRAQYESSKIKADVIVNSLADLIKYI